MRLDDLQRILSLSTRAPSADNCQPFRFHWDGARLLLFHDEVRAAYPLDASAVGSRLTLGCQLEALHVAAAVHGFGCRAKLVAPPHPPCTPWAEVAFVAGHAGPRPSAEPLLARCTDRRIYHGGSIDDPVFATLTRDAAATGGARLHFRPPDDALVEYCAHTEELVWSWKATQQAIAGWFRLDRGEVERTRDGMRRESIDLDALGVRVLRRCRADYRYQRLANRLGFLRVLRRRMRARVRSSAALGCVTVEAPTWANVVAAGRVSMRAWLALTECGYGFQPISAATILVLGRAAGREPAGLPAAFSDAIARGEQVLRRTFGLAAGETPAWLFRTGRAPRGRAAARNLRLDLSSVLSVTAAGG
jgi:hypothetical protein